LNARFVTLIAAAGVVVGVSATYLLTTVIMDALPDAVTVAGAALVAALVTALVTRPSPRRVAAAPRNAVWAAIAGGIACWWAAPLLTLAQRSSDAPSGSETLFFMTSVVGAACMAAGFVWFRVPRHSLVIPAAAVAGLAAAAGLLASWERPSSFSPFVRFPVQEAWMCVAAVLFAAGALSLAWAARRLGSCDAGAIALSAAAAAGVVAAIPSYTTLAGTSAEAWTGLFYLGLALALWSASWVRVVERSGMLSAGSCLLLGPIALTLLAGVERLVAVYGASPVDWPAAVACAVVLGLAVAAVWSAESPGHVSPMRATSRITALLAASLVAAAVASLFTPALQATVTGHVADRFSASWVQPGYLSGSGWLAFSAAITAAAVAVAASTGRARRTWAVASVLAVACSVAVWPLAATTLRTQNGWIPAAVQQAYGTEYAQFSVVPVVDPLRMTVVACSVALVVYVSARHLMASGDGSKEKQ
jgi:hypothetical protein